MRTGYTESFSFCIRGSFTLFPFTLAVLYVVLSVILYMPTEELLDPVSSNVHVGVEPKVTSVKEHQPVIMETDQPVNMRRENDPCSLLWELHTQALTHLPRGAKKKKARNNMTPSTRVSSHQQKKESACRDLGLAWLVNNRSMLQSVTMSCQRTVCNGFLKKPTFILAWTTGV